MAHDLGENSLALIFGAGSSTPVLDAGSLGQALAANSSASVQEQQSWIKKANQTQSRINRNGVTSESRDSGSRWSPKNHVDFNLHDSFCRMLPCFLICIKTSRKCVY